MDKYEENPDEIINEIIKQKSNNMEFKGTKGKCELSIPFDGTILINGNVKATVLPYSIKGLQQEDKANAVLFSKAPEMLEMLQKCRKTFKEKYNLTVLELDNLIKEATTI